METPESEQHRRNNILNREKLKAALAEIKRKKFLETHGPLLDERDERNRRERTSKEED